MEPNAKHCRDEQRRGGVLRIRAGSRRGVSAMCDLGWEMNIFFWVDRSAAITIACPLGLGWTRYIEVLLHWLQESVHQRRLEFGKIKRRPRSSRYIRLVAS